MAYRMFLARALQCPTKKAIGSFKLLHFEANVYYFFCCKLCSHVYQLLAYIKHFASFHYETISFPERNTLHAYTHTQHIQLVIVHSMCAIRFFATLSLFASRSTYYIYFLLLQLVCCSIAHCVLSATVNYVYNMCIL